MRALSIKQPWASLIAHGIKDIENRTWPTKFRGRICLHSSAQMTKGKYSEFIPKEYWSTLSEEQKNELINFSQLNSSIIGEVDIVDCVINHPSIWAEKTQIIGHTIEGEILYSMKPIWNWVLANPVLYKKPIENVKGALSFWDPKLTVCNHCLEWVKELVDGFGCKECVKNHK